jgi:hypothetical protein
VLCAAYAALALLGPSTAVAQRERYLYAGVVDEHMWVGVSVAAGRASVFLCGDADTVAVDTHWFKGAAAVDGRWWRFDAGGWTVWTRSWREGTLGALVRPDQPVTWWWAPRAHGGAGLYRAVTEHGVAGAILLDRDGDGELELQGALKLAASGNFMQVIPIGPVLPTYGTVVVYVPSAVLDDGDQSGGQAGGGDADGGGDDAAAEADAGSPAGELGGLIEISVYELDPTTL